MTWDKVRETLSATWARLREYPRTLQAIGWFLLGFVIGKLL